METKSEIDFACMAPGSEKTVEAVWKTEPCSMCEGTGYRIPQWEGDDSVCPYCGGSKTQIIIHRLKEVK